MKVPILMTRCGNCANLRFLKFTKTNILVYCCPQNSGLDFEEERFGEKCALFKEKAPDVVFEGKKEAQK